MDLTSAEISFQGWVFFSTLAKFLFQFCSSHFTFYYSIEKIRKKNFPEMWQYCIWFLSITKLHALRIILSIPIYIYSFTHACYEERVKIISTIQVSIVTQVTANYRWRPNWMHIWSTCLSFLHKIVSQVSINKSWSGETVG